VPATWIAVDQPLQWLSATLKVDREVGPESTDFRSGAECWLLFAETTILLPAAQMTDVHLFLPEQAFAILRLWCDNLPPRIELPDWETVPLE